MSDIDKNNIEQSNIEYTDQVRALLSQAVDDFSYQHSVNSKQKEIVAKLLQALDAVVVDTSGR